VIAAARVWQEEISILDRLPWVEPWSPHTLHFKVTIEARETGELLWVRPYRTEQKAIRAYFKLVGLQLVPSVTIGELTVALLRVVTFNASNSDTSKDWSNGGSLCPPTVTSVAQMLICAGGGGGGYPGNGTIAHAGGGGAGGQLIVNSIAVTQYSAYNMVVGAGGHHPGSNGDNSSGLGTTVIGGGGGGGFYANNGSNGGSGGGAGGNGVTAGQGHFGGNGTSGQGNAGGNGFSYASDVSQNAGGGGGAQVRGNDPAGISPMVGANGAIGMLTSIRGVGERRGCGGGGAGTGGDGLGGNNGTPWQGGNASSFGTPVAAPANSGSGGGGSGNGNYGGGDAGSGVVILSFQQSVSAGLNMAMLGM
jgi:hypothetical protein